MTKREQMQALRDHGMTYQAIAEEFGCTRQYVYQMIGTGEGAHFRLVTKDGCIYPGLRRWMNENLCSRQELLRRMGRIAWPNSAARLTAYLRGYCEPSKRTIDDILKATGMTYEECFGGVD